jgi:hypothetical protein
VGSSVIVLGGQASDGSVYGPGVAAFDVITGSWRSLPDPPYPFGRRPAAAVLGDSVYVLSGMDSPIAFMRYDPSDERWTVLDWSGQLTSEHHLTPYGDLLVQWGPSDPALRAFDPSTDTWRDVPADPLSTLADRAVVVTPAGLVVLARSGTDPYQAALLVDGAWSSLPAAPGGAASRAWFATGTGVLGVDQSGSVVTLDPSTGAWSERPEPSGPAGWSGIPPVADGRWITASGWIVDSVTSRQAALTAPGGGALEGAAAAWIGPHLVVWGGERAGDQGGTLVGDGWRWSAGADGGASAPGSVPGTAVPGTAVPGTAVPRTAPSTTAAATDHGPGAPPAGSGRAAVPLLVSGGFRGTDTYDLGGRGCAQLAHTVDLDLTPDGEGPWRYHAEVCGAIDADDVWSGTGPFTITAPDGTLTGTVHSRAQLPTTGEPYIVDVLAGTGRLAGRTGSCRLDNHLRETRLGAQEQWGSFTCELRAPAR